MRSKEVEEAIGNVHQCINTSQYPDDDDMETVLAYISELEAENIRWRGKYHLLSRKICVTPNRVIEDKIKELEKDEKDILEEIEKEKAKKIKDKAFLKYNREILYRINGEKSVLKELLEGEDDMHMLKKRNFEFVERVKEVAMESTEGAYCKLPERSTGKSAGYDFYVPEDTVCKAHEITMVKTGVKAYFPEDEMLLLFNRSSNPKKKGLIILNGVGVVDADYYNNPDNEGEIAGLFYNMLDEDVFLKAGEKMMQGIFVKYGTVDNDNASGERTGGFGSTGR